MKIVIPGGSGHLGGLAQQLFKLLPAEKQVTEERDGAFIVKVDKSGSVLKYHVLPEDEAGLASPNGLPFQLEGSPSDW